MEIAKGEEMIDYIPIFMFSVSGVALATLISSIMWVIYRPRLLQVKLLGIHSEMQEAARVKGYARDERVVARLKSIRRVSDNAADFSMLLLVHMMLEDYRNGAEASPADPSKKNDDVDRFVREYSDWTTRAILTYIFYCTMSGTAVRAVSHLFFLGKSCRSAMSRVISSMLSAFEPASLSRSGARQRMC